LWSQIEFHQKVGLSAAQPSPEARRYESATACEFGEPIVLPEPFGVTIDTTEWRAWSGLKV
jgi:hypothetical protein